MDGIPLESELRLRAFEYWLWRFILRLGIPSSLIFVLLYPDMAHARPPVVTWSTLLLKWGWLMTPLLFVECAETLSRGQFDAVVSRTSQTLRLWRGGWKHEFTLTTEGFTVKRTPGPLGYVRAFLRCYEITTPSGKYLVKFHRTNHLKRMRRMVGQEQGSPWDVED